MAVRHSQFSVFGQSSGVGSVVGNGVGEFDSGTLVLNATAGRAAGVGGKGLEGQEAFMMTIHNSLLLPVLFAVAAASEHNTDHQQAKGKAKRQIIVY